MGRRPGPQASKQASRAQKNEDACRQRAAARPPLLPHLKSAYTCSDKMPSHAPTACPRSPRSPEAREHTQASATRRGVAQHVLRGAWARRQAKASGRVARSLRRGAIRLLDVHLFVCSVIRLACWPPPTPPRGAARRCQHAHKPSPAPASQWLPVRGLLRTEPRADMPGFPLPHRSPQPPAARATQRRHAHDEGGKGYCAGRGEGEGGGPERVRVRVRSEEGRATER